MSYVTMSPPLAEPTTVSAEAVPSVVSSCGGIRSKRVSSLPVPSRCTMVVRFSLI